jgi:glycosyltransferase involved in cell wall biosynthesis
MKVAIVHTDFRLYWHPRIQALTEYLATKDIILYIVEIAGSGSPYYFFEKPTLKQDNWHILFPEKKAEEVQPKLARKKVFGKLDELNPDVLISGPIAFYSGAAAVLWAVNKKKKLIVFDDARLIDVPRPWWINVIKRMIYSGVDAIFCPSPEWIPTFKFFGFNEEQLFFGVDVVDNDFWRNKDKISDIQIGLPPEGYFITAGRQVKKKNLMFLLESYLNYITDQNNPRHLVVIGDGPENPDLRKFCEGKGLKDLVHFYSFMAQFELRKAFKSASWFILPSKYGETWGLVVNEAMASGLPVILSDQVGCASTIVKEAVNGFLFSPDNSEALAEILTKAAGMPEEQRLFFAKKSMEVISFWGMDRFTWSLHNAITHVISERKRTSSFLSRILMKLWYGRYRPS